MQTSDGLKEWERRIPRLQALAEMFAGHPDEFGVFNKRWDVARLLRFLEFQRILIRNWRAMEEQARQMAHQPQFQKLWKSIAAIRDLVMLIRSMIGRAMGGNFFSMMAMETRPKGVVLQ